MNKRIFFNIISLLLIAFNTVQPQHKIKTSQFNNGSGLVSNSEKQILANIGQNAVGNTQNDTYNINSGFWFLYYITEISNTDIQLIPNKYTLFQNYPNPFNPTTKIKFAIPKNERVKLVIYNITGQKIKTLFDHEMLAGFYEVTFTANNIASGIYIIHLTAGSYVNNKKMILLK